MTVKIIDENNCNLHLGSYIRYCYCPNKNPIPGSVQSRFAEGVMTYCGLLSTSWSEVKWHISQGLQVLGEGRKASLSSILSRTCQVIRGNNFLPGRLHKTFSCLSISNARTMTGCTSANVAQSLLGFVKLFIMLKSRAMWLVMLCWRPGDQGLYWARTTLYFFFVADVASPKNEH